MFVRPQTRFGNFTLGLTPKVVGTISQIQTLTSINRSNLPACDIVEVRVDLLGTGIDEAGKIETAGLPVIATIRLANEGGKWTAPDADRLPLFERALRQLTTVDIEYRSPLLPAVSELACRHQRPLIISYHDFEKTPPLPELQQVIRAAANYGTVVKIATFARDEADLMTLRELFKEQCSSSVCILGMGPLAAQTRLEFPRLGSCLTYGYLDVPIAPGQPAASELMVQLSR